MAFLGSFGKLLGKGLKGVSKVAGVIPGVGTLAGGAMGGLGELLEKGSKTNLGGFLGSAGGGALSGTLSGLLGLGGGGEGGGGIKGFLSNAIGGLTGGGEGGSTVGSLGKLLGLGLGGAQVYGDYKQSKKDSKYARALADEALESYRSARTMAQDRWASQSPLRDAFNFGAFNMSDSTNPFSRDLFSSFAPQAVQQTDTAPGYLGALMGTNTGGRGIGAPTNRAASVKSGRNAQAQDRGRDRSRGDDDEMRLR